MFYYILHVIKYTIRLNNIINIMNRVYIFDLDDTLVLYTRKGLTVPKQTFHMLRALSHYYKIVIISYNPFAHIIAKHLGLLKYVSNVICGDYDSHILFQQAMNLFPINT